MDGNKGLVKKSFIVISSILAILLIVDYAYFKGLRGKADTFALPESFLKKGLLGDILKDNALIKVSHVTESLATSDMCADRSQLKGYDYHNTYQMRFKISATHVEKVHIKVNFPKAKRYRVMQDVFEVKPGRHFYKVDFVAHKGLGFQVQLKSQKKGQIILSDILVDGRFGRTQTLLQEGKPVRGEFEQNLPLTVSSVESDFNGVELSPVSHQMVFSVPNGLEASLYSGVFPGKKNQGYCRYVAYSPKKLNKPKQHVVPTVNLHVEEEYLFGEQGILDNKEGKGRIWEVPADYSVQNKSRISQQSVGLRFHGGEPGRKKNIASFRINARNAYGKPVIDYASLMSGDRAKDLKGVVFKYTYQAYDLKKTNYNPYNHAFALDIANQVGAIVPAHALVDLNINQESQGLYLAMEHLSKRTIQHWLGDKEVTLYTYKKHNSEHQQFALFYPIGEILKTKGEAAFDLFLESYDLSNIINSIILSAYISDDDYCQGVDVIEQKKTDNQQKFMITSVNWDLDHALLAFDNAQYSMPVKREGIGEAFDILKQNKPHRLSLCPRKWVYSHVYTESLRFRMAIRERLEALLSSELKPQRVSSLIEKYRYIDKGYFQGDHSKVLDQMVSYAQQRPQKLLQALNDLEELVDKGLNKLKL